MCKDVRKVARSIALEQWQWEYLDALREQNKSEYMREAFKLKYKEDKEDYNARLELRDLE